MIEKLYIAFIFLFGTIVGRKLQVLLLCKQYNDVKGNKWPPIHHQLYQHHQDHQGERVPLSFNVFCVQIVGNRIIAWLYAYNNPLVLLLIFMVFFFSHTHTIVVHIRILERVHKSFKRKVVALYIKNDYFALWDKPCWY